MQVKLSNKGTTLIASIIGELDHHSAEDARNKVDNEIIKATTKNVVFDFSKVNFMDSSGIGVIMGRYKNLQKLKGKVALVNPSPHIKRIFEMAGLFKFIPLFDTVDKAVREFEG